jgi:hypothetical protein
MCYVPKLTVGVRVASGLQVAFGAIGGIYASTVFMQKEAPLYRTGLWAVTVSFSIYNVYLETDELIE